MARKRELVGYCGAYCPECPGYTHSTANLAKDLRGEFRRYGFGKAAPALGKLPKYKAFKHYDKCYELLGVIAKMRCKGACRAGGGGAGCVIRKCAKKKRFAGCWECDEFATCKTLAVLEKYGDSGRSYLKNLRKLKRDGVAAYVRQKTGGRV
jgi:hypothetical protein